MTVKGDSGGLSKSEKCSLHSLNRTLTFALIGLTHHTGSPRTPETLAPVLILNTNWLTKNSFGPSWPRKENRLRYGIQVPRAVQEKSGTSGMRMSRVLSASSPKVNVGRRLNFKSHLKLSVGSFLHFLRHLETVQQLLFFPFKPLKLPLALLSSQFLLLHALLVVLECTQLS